MRVLQAGIDKSGNFWLWQIVRLLMDEAGIPRNSWIVNDPIYQVSKTWKLSFPQATELDVITWDTVPASAYVSESPASQPFRERSYYYCVIPMYRRRIENLSEYARANSHLWTHAPWHDALPNDLLGELDKLVYIVRDPRDILVSAAHYVDTEYCRREFGIPRIPLADRYERLLKTCVEWAVHVAGWIGHARETGLHVVSYEGLRNDLHFQVTRLSEYFGLALDEQQISRVVAAASFGSMKADASGGHVRKGVVGNWRQELPETVASRATEMCRPLLDAFGYTGIDRGLSAFLERGEISDATLATLAQINELQFHSRPARSQPRPAVAQAAPVPGFPGGLR